MRDRRSVVRSTKALHEVRHEVRGPDAYMGFLHEVYAQNELKCCETTAQMKKFLSTNIIERSSICQSWPKCCTFYRVRL